MKRKILSIISGLCVGIGVGACFGVAMHNIVVGPSVRFELRNMLCRDFCLCREEKIVAFLKKVLYNNIRR